MIIIINSALQERHRQLIPRIKKAFSTSRVRIELTRSTEHARYIVNRSISRKESKIVVAGGDGTLNSVINLIFQSNCTLGIIPIGTANDLASYYEIPAEIETACKIIQEGYSERIDLIEVNGWYYATAGGIGLPADIAHFANEFKRKALLGRLSFRIIGSKVYLLFLAYLFLTNRLNYYRAEIKTNGRLIDSNLFFFLANNQPFLGKHFLATPGADNQDGLINICLSENPDFRLQQLRILLGALRGNHIYSPWVQTWVTNILEIKTTEAQYFMGDGELSAKSKNFKICIHPKALNLIIPKNIS